MADADNHSAALAYAAAGIYVGPLRRNPDGTIDKNPGSLLGKGWQYKTSRDPQQITAMFAGTNYGVFLHCGRSGLIVFDVDYLAEFPTAYRQHLEAAPYQQTRPDEPGRGHYVFTMPPRRTIGNSGGRLGGKWGEVRGLNGVIVAEPSEDRYQWVRTGLAPLLDAKLAELLDDATAAADAATDATVAEFIDRHTAGARPDALNGLRAALAERIDDGQSVHVSTVSVVAGALKEAAAGLYPARHALDTLKPLFINAVAHGGSTGTVRVGTVAESEWDGIVAWGVGQALAADPAETVARVAKKMPEAATIDGPADTDDADTTRGFSPKLWRARDLRTGSRPEWLARHRLPRAAVSLLVGDEGIGKSLFWVWLIRYITTGQPCPQFGIPARQPGHVILVCTEDDWETTIEPRLRVASVDLDMVRVICESADGSGAPMFPRDMQLIRDARPAADLVIVDAWLDTVQPGLKVKDPQHAREALHPWKDLATTTGAAILLLTHTNRVASGNARDKYGITGELRKVARMTLFAQEADDDTEGADDDAKVLLIGPEKANTARPVPAARFTIKSVQHFPPSEDFDGTVPQLAYAGDSSQTARQHIADAHADATGTTETNDAVTWLATYLAAGPRWSAQLHEDRKAQGISDRQLRTAKSQLRVTSSRGSADGPWYMALPTHPNQMPTEPVPLHRTSGTSWQVNPDAHPDHSTSPRTSGGNQPLVTSTSQDSQRVSTDIQRTSDRPASPLAGARDLDFCSGCGTFYAVNGHHRADCSRSQQSRIGVTE